MVERNGLLTLLTHGVLICGVALVGFPLYLALVASSHSPQELAQAPIPIWFGDQLWQSYSAAITGDGRASAQGAAARMLWVSFVVAMAITVGKISVSLLSAFALVYFRFPLRRLCFWAIFITLMLPVEVRIGPTYQVIADLHMVNSFAGLAVPLIAASRLVPRCRSSSPQITYGKAAPRAPHAHWRSTRRGRPRRKTR
jgi:sn-glycerol 3-phosphate transport system permease protein